MKNNKTDNIAVREEMHAMAAARWAYMLSTAKMDHFKRSLWAGYLMGFSLSMGVFVLFMLFYLFIYLFMTKVDIDFKI